MAIFSEDQMRRYMPPNERNYAKTKERHTDQEPDSRGQRKDHNPSKQGFEGQIQAFAEGTWVPNSHAYA